MGLEPISDFARAEYNESLRTETITKDYEMISSEWLARGLVVKSQLPVLIKLKGIIMTNTIALTLGPTVFTISLFSYGYLSWHTNDTWLHMPIEIMGLILCSTSMILTMLGVVGCFDKKLKSIDGRKYG